MVLLAEYNLVSYQRFGYLTGYCIYRLLHVRERTPRVDDRARTGKLIALRNLVVRIIREERFTGTSATCRQSSG